MAAFEIGGAAVGVGWANWAVGDPDASVVGGVDGVTAGLGVDVAAAVGVLSGVTAMGARGGMLPRSRSVVACVRNENCNAGVQDSVRCVDELR